MNPITQENTLNSPPFWLSNAWQGAFFKIMSCACFAGINGLVRHLSHGVAAEGIAPLPTAVIMFFQNLFGTLFLLPWILKAGKGSLTTQRTSLNLLRVGFAVLGVFLWYLTLKNMPLAEGVALSFTGPIITLIGATLFLHEKITTKRFTAIILSLTGAFIISRPDLALKGEGFGLALLFPLGATVAFTIDKLLTRKLASLGEKASAMAIYLLTLMIPFSFVPAALEWTSPTTVHWPWLIAAGALAAAAHLFFGKAYQLAEVTFLTPVGFSKFFFSALVGYLAFGEFPTRWPFWIGIGFIFFSILILFNFSQKNRL
jgi:drug/metabolite transporter (DMT)-like permease